jgi:single-stranded DNA-binding protein
MAPYRGFNERIVDVAERFLKKGPKVYVEGQLHTRKCEDGQIHYTTEVELARFKNGMAMLTRPSTADQQARTDDSPHQAYAFSCRDRHATLSPPLRQAVP